MIKRITLNFSHETVKNALIDASNVQQRISSTCVCRHLDSCYSQFDVDFQILPLAFLKWYKRSHFKTVKNGKLRMVQFSRKNFDN